MKKKKIFIAIVILALSTGVNAQKKGLLISINGGVAAPLGNFKKADYADPKSGFSKTGGNINLGIAYHLNKIWSIDLVLGNSQFGRKDFNNLADGYKEDSGTDSTTLVTRGANNAFSVLIGPRLSIPVTKKFNFHIRALGGYTNATLAGFQIFYEDYTDNALTQEKAKAGAFGLQFGIGASYSITKKICILVNGDYFTSKPKFDIKYENFIVNSGRKLITYEEPFQSFNATVGIGFKLF
jgi:opacity protein-like surface antigen